MLRMLMFLMVVSYALAWPAAADPYWIAYEGNDFPENEGWERVYRAGGAERRIEDGALVLDSLDDIMIVDFYQMTRQIDPDPGETFMMRWRLKVDQVPSHEDPTVVVFSDESWAVGFDFSETGLISGFEPGLGVDFDPGAYHDFELRSTDMRSYELSVDGALALTGQFKHVITASKVAWGDGVQGATSFARWDYFEFGVVPEPSAIALFTIMALAALRCRRDIL